MDRNFEIIEKDNGVFDAFALKNEDGSKASLRCEDGYDVAAVAARFGGGGHKNAAGCSFDVPAKEAEAVLRKALCTIVSEKQNA